MTQNAVNLYDRVKELSYTTGTNDFELSGASAGFSRFRRFYDHDDIILYGITDGTFYEVGSGVFKREDYSSIDNIHVDTIVRNPFRSSNSDDSKVNFPAGTKEVYITYPATHSVIMGSGLSQGLNVPQRNGVAVWDSENVLNYFSNFVFTENGGLGINQPNPFYGVDLGGDEQDYSSRVRASGYYVGPTGIYFQANTTGANSNDVGLNTDASPYVGGRQFVHFKPNLTDAGVTPTTNSHLVFDVSGVVNEYLLLKKQSAGQVFAGPLTSCGSPPCDADYPSFRLLGSGDLPISELDTLYTTNIQLAITSGDLVAYTDTEILSASGTLDSAISGVQSNLDVHISGYASDFRDFEIASSGRIDTYLDNASGILYPHTASVSKTLSSMSSGDVRAESFTVNGVSASSNYTVNISPSGNLNENLLITHGFVASDNTVSGIFYAPSAFSGQTMTFFISAHEVH